jgi:hypothetical protein
MKPQTIEDLGYEDLLVFLGLYNNYVLEFFDDHDEGSQPVSTYEWFDNEYQSALDALIGDNE